MAYYSVGKVVVHVAPYAGAWIETFLSVRRYCSIVVAPYAGAWIETILPAKHYMKCAVAPYAGAWIETKYHQQYK